MSRTGRMHLVGEHPRSIVEGLRGLLIKQREDAIARLRTTQTELTERVRFFEQHQPRHDLLPATRQRLEDVANKIIILEGCIADLRATGVK